MNRNAGGLTHVRIRSWTMIRLVAATILVGDSAIILLVGGGLNLGTILPGIMGLALFVYGFVKGPVSKVVESKAWAYLKKPAFVLLCIFMSSVASVETVILVNAFAGDVGPTDWCIVLGAGLRGDRLSMTLTRRMERAVTFLKEHPGTRVVVSGGRGPGESLTEAEAMSGYLVAAGIAPERIVQECSATSTRENLVFSKALIEQNGGAIDRPVSVISSDFHLFRVKWIGRRLGLHVVPVPAPTPWYLLPNTCLREYFAVVKTGLFDR